MSILQWLGEVEDRIVTGAPVTPAERIAQKVRRACTDQCGGWMPQITRRESRPFYRRLARKAQRMRARGWPANQIQRGIFWPITHPAQR